MQKEQASSTFVRSIATRPSTPSNMQIQCLRKDIEQLESVASYALGFPHPHRIPDYCLDFDSSPALHVL
jgi:hypothetical protein